MKHNKKLAVIHTHPIQYLAPLYRQIQQQGIPVTAVYGSDFSIVGYKDEEFDTSFAWDKDLVSGYTSKFLERSQGGGARSVEEASVRRLWQVLTNVEPTSIMLSAYYPWFHSLACVISIVYASTYDVNLLFRAETTDHAQERGLFHKYSRDVILSVLYSYCDHFFYIGKRSKKHYEKFNIEEENMSFSPYSVDRSSFMLEEKHRQNIVKKALKEMKLKKSSFKILFVGKLSYRKGVDMLVDAVGNMEISKRKNTTVIFVGQGDAESSLKRKAAKKDVDAHFVGFQKQSDLSKFYHAANVLVLPSRWGETWGLVVNEALHHGIPAIVSNQVGCAPDLINEGFTGEVFESGSVESLKRAVAKVYNKYCFDSERRKKIKKYVEKYSIKKSAKSVVEVIKKSQIKKE